MSHLFKDKEKDRVFLTGASGMVGRAVHARLLASERYELLTPSSGELDLRDQGATHRYLVRNRPRFVVHMAGHIGGIHANISRPVEFLYENLIMAMNVIHSSAEVGVERLIFLGSSCIYPRNCPQPMKESMLLSGPLEPTNEGYSIAKIAGIRLCQYLNIERKCDYISLLPCNLYGPYDKFDTQDSHVIPALMSRIHDAKVHDISEVEIWGSGASRREFLHVNDMADAISFFLKVSLEPSAPRVFNVGSGLDISIRDLALLIGEVVGYEGTYRFNEKKPDGMPRKCMDVGRTSRLGWEARTTLREGLERTYTWFLKQKENRHQ